MPHTESALILPPLGNGPSTEEILVHVDLPEIETEYAEHNIYNNIMFSQAFVCSQGWGMALPIMHHWPHDQGVYLLEGGGSAS